MGEHRWKVWSMPFFESRDNTRLYFKDWGAGRPVLFCSAWALDSSEFQYQMVGLVERGFRVISYDRRGHGRSDDPGRGYEYDTLADDLAALIEHLDLDGLILVGHSMAGGEIVRYLTRHGRRRVAGVVLVAAMLPFPLRTESNPDGVEAAQFEAAREQWHGDFGQWLADNQGAYFGDGLPGCAVSDLVRDATLAQMQTTSLLAVLQCSQAITDTDFRQEMPGVSVPALIIQGDRDASIPIEISGYKQAELLPNSRLVVYQNGPHGLYLTHHDRLTRDLAEFALDPSGVVSGVAAGRP